MKTTIDSAGRLVIPKRIREQAGMTPGSEIDVRFCDGHVELEAAAVEVMLEERDGFLVAVPTGPAPVLTNEMVTALIRQDREDRLDSLAGIPIR
jgi:AbrB family looped-hinge helix DNA binding protein